MEPLLGPLEKYPPHVAFYNTVLVEVRRVGVRKILKLEPKKPQFLYVLGVVFPPEGLIYTI